MALKTTDLIVVLALLASIHTIVGLVVVSISVIIGLEKQISGSIMTNIGHMFIREIPTTVMVRFVARYEQKLISWDIRMAILDLVVVLLLIPYM